jgi:hypothetical protein
MVSDLTRPEPNFEGTSIVVTARREGGRIRLRLVLGASRTLDAGELRAITTVATMLEAGVRVALCIDEIPGGFPAETFAKECEALRLRAFEAYEKTEEGKEAVRG